jgi:hypothetical protein
MVDHGVVRNFRIAGMVIVALLLGFSLGLSGIAVGSTQPLGCVFRAHWNPGNLITLLPTYVTLFFSYGVRIRGLYRKNDHALYFLTRLIWRRKSRRSTKSDLPFDRQFAEALAERRLAQVLNIADKTGIRKQLLKGHFFYADSFLSTLPDIGFSFSYGLTQTVQYRWTSAPKLSPESSRMGFGQLMPILLLLLPMLAAEETYYGKCAAWNNTCLC